MAYVIVAIFFIGGFEIYDVCKNSFWLSAFVWMFYITCFVGIITGILASHSKHFTPHNDLQKPTTQSEEERYIEYWKRKLSDMKQN